MTLQLRTSSSIVTLSPRIGTTYSFSTTSTTPVSLGTLASNRLQTSLAWSSYANLNNMSKTLASWTEFQDEQSESGESATRDQITVKSACQFTKLGDRLTVGIRKLIEFFGFNAAKEKIDYILKSLFVVLTILRDLHYINCVSYVLKIAVFSTLFGGNRDLPVG